MLNTEDFIKRLEQLFEQHGLNAASFSDKIGVQRSSISHLLSGRNKPSLDFILKVIAAFPETDLYWLIAGKENTIKRETVAKPELKPGKPAKSEIARIVIFYSDGSFSEHSPTR